MVNQNFRHNRLVVANITTNNGSKEFLALHWIVGYYYNVSKIARNII